jgi:uracil-DNA glycosylase
MTETESRSDAEVDPRAELRSLTVAVRQYAEQLDRMGIYSARGGGGLPPVDVPVAAPEEAPAEPSRGPSLEVVREELGECTRCKLSTSRTNIVFGVGSQTAALMFVGEAPGAEEDRRGEPFVGAAGQLLDRMIAAMGWTRDSVYIANVLKCRPPGNRDPEADEVAECLPFLHRQIESIAPRLIVTLGKPAAHALLGTTAPISALRGRFHEFHGIPVMPTFHPAFLLRSPDRKRDAWSDLKQVIDELERLGVRSPNTPKV